MTAEAKQVAASISVSPVEQADPEFVIIEDDEPKYTVEPKAVDAEKDDSKDDTNTLVAFETIAET